MDEIKSILELNDDLENSKENKKIIGISNKIKNLFYKASKDCSYFLNYSKQGDFNDPDCCKHKNHKFFGHVFPFCSISLCPLREAPHSFLSKFDTEEISDHG